jgi:hypothetical protein
VVGGSVPNKNGVRFIQWKLPPFFEGGLGGRKMACFRHPPHLATLFLKTICLGQLIWILSPASLLVWRPNPFHSRAFLAPGPIRCKRIVRC